MLDIYVATHLYFISTECYIGGFVLKIHKQIRAAHLSACKLICPPKYPSSMWQSVGKMLSICGDMGHARDCAKISAVRKLGYFANYLAARLNFPFGYSTNTIGSN